MAGVFDRKQINLYRVTFPSGASKLKRLDQDKVDLYKNHNCKVTQLKKSPALANRAENESNQGQSEPATQGQGG